MFHLYGFLIGIGIIASAAISAWLARRRNYPPNIIWDGFWWVIIPSLIGARLYHVIDLWPDYYRFNILNSFFVWNGGLAIFGALPGGFLGLFLYYKLKIKNCKLKIQFLTLLNLISFSLPLAQSIGRLGNYFNKELYGLSSSLPWAINIGGTTYHPLFAYESIWLLIGFLIMLFSELRHVIPHPSAVSSGSDCRFRPKAEIAESIQNNYFAFYLIWYGTGRFFLEFLRPSQFSWIISIAPWNLNINIAQLLSVLIIIIGIKKITANK